MHATRYLDREGRPPSSRTGWLLGLLDAVYVVPSYLKKLCVPSLRHWTDGWGDLTSAKQVYSEARDILKLHAQGPQYYAAHVNIHNHSSCGEGCTVLKGSFKSPLQACLPEETAMVPFQAVLPPGEPWAVVVICAGTADETFLYRRKALAEPLLLHGVACLLPMMPFYGPRRRRGQRLFYLKTFMDLMLQCYAGASENNLLLDWARVHYPHALLGLVGMSHGAGAAVASAAYAHHDLAVVPLLLPTSPAVLATGSLEHDLALDALGAGHCQGAPSWDDVRDVVVDTLESAMGPEAGGEVSPPARGVFVRCVVAACAANDRFVLPEWGTKALNRVKETLDPEAELHWVPGGHVSSFLIARWLFIRLVLRGLLRLQQTRSGAAGSSRL